MSVRHGTDELDSYSDLHIQHVYHTLTRKSGADAGVDISMRPPKDEEALHDLDVLGDGRRIDNDEVAELVAFYRQSAAHLHSTGGGQTTIGELWCDVRLGANMTGTETMVATLNPDYDIGVDIDDSGTDDFTIQGKNADEPGIFDAFQIASGVGFKDAATNTAAGNEANMVERWMNFKRDLVGGPILDANDQLQIATHMSTDSPDSLTVDTYYILYWDVQELDELRPSFGRPL